MYKTRPFLATLQATEARRENAFSRNLREAMVTFVFPGSIRDNHPMEPWEKKAKKKPTRISGLGSGYHTYFEGVHQPFQRPTWNSLLALLCTIHL
jgi:hypothetical protein